MTVTLEQMQEIVGHRFPGGTYTIESWENVLLSDVTGVVPLPGGIAHPAFLFHAPLVGVGVRVQDIFELCHAESEEAVRAGEYRWVLKQPLWVGATYRMSGGFTGVERKQGRRGGLMDIVSFEIELRDETGALAATTIASWIFLRSEN
jgi:hypothetical protein